MRQALEPYEHVQVWGDADPEQRALIKRWGLSLAYPTLVFLDRSGSPVYTTRGYKKPEPFLADCVKASELLSVSVPEDARSASANETPSGKVLERKGTAGGANASVTPANGVGQSSAKIWYRNAQPNANDGFMNSGIPPVHAVAVPLTPLREASFDIANGKYDSAIAKASKIVEGNPQNVDARYLLAVAYVMTRKYAQAVEQYKSVIKLQPNSRAALLAREGLKKLGQ